MNRSDVFDEMRSLVLNGEYVDAATGEVNCTKLAEQIIDYLNIDENDEDVCFDIAVDVAEWYNAGGR